jgi:hypothetical protein
MLPYLIDKPRLILSATQISSTRDHFAYQIKMILLWWCRLIFTATLLLSCTGLTLQFCNAIAGSTVIIGLHNLSSFIFS